MTQSFPTGITPKDIEDHPELAEIFTYILEIKNRTGFGKLVIEFEHRDVKEIQITHSRRPKLEGQRLK